MSATRLNRNYSEDTGARVWDIKTRALLDVWVVKIAALPTVKGAFDDKLWMSRSKGQSLLTGRQ